MAPTADPGDAYAMRSSLQRGSPEPRDQAAIYQPDPVLARRAREGDADAFGVLYLRHHHAVWRLAHAASGFARWCPDVVVETFSRVLRRGTPTVDHRGSCRPELLAEVRRLAAGMPYCEPEPELVIFPDGGQQPVVASPLVVEAFCRLHEPQRSAWWLLEVERLTPREAAAVMRLSRSQIAGHHADAEHELVAYFADVDASATTLCRAAERTSFGQKPNEVTSFHIRSCLVCRMRRQEKLRPAVALCDAVPPMPLLGLRCQHRWQTV